MSEPLVVEFRVRAEVEECFAAWVDRFESWWPRGHTMTGDPAALRFEGRVGGRIVEVGRDGDEHVWGEVTVIEPPHRIVFEWHLMFDRSEATSVELTFHAAGDVTEVRIVQTGWERLGDRAAGRRERTFGGWMSVLHPFADFLRA